jgi:exodeoxyribonuclease-3
VTGPRPVAASGDDDATRGLKRLPATGELRPERDIVMKIATFNINNVNKRLPNLLRWLRSSSPDVVCLQEIKCTQEDFPIKAIRDAGYAAAWQGQRSWNGVAILSRGAEPIVTRTRLPGVPEDRQSRYLEAAVAGILIGCLYLPNGNPQPGPKFDYKIEWFKRLSKHAQMLLQQDIPAVLAGDFNVAPTALDIYPTTSWDGDALVQPQVRQAYARLLRQGWTDSLRQLHGDARIYTFWHYMRNRWPRDAGLRLDHILLSPSLSTELLRAGVDRHARGESMASDHAPAWITLRRTAR